MNLLVFCIICVSLQVTYQSLRGHWTLLPNVLVVEVDGSLSQQSLSCLQRPEDPLWRHNQSQDIFWKKNGVKKNETGNSYLVQLVESFGGGNYTCHSKDGSLLNHTEVLIRHPETRILVKSDQDDYLKCSTQNYDGAFDCAWTWDSIRVGRVAFIKVARVADPRNTECSVDSSNRRWICSSAHSNFSCSVHEDGRGISCLDQQHCPYAEENQQISVTVFVRTDHYLLESYSKLFFLSAIVKPGKVTIGRVNKTVVEWSYPSSWSTPHSYFPLTFEVAQVRARCKNCENPCTALKPSKPLGSTDICRLKVKRHTKAVCIRAKDALCNSQWSDWSHVRLRKNRKNKKLQKKKLS
ncbi:interleukin 12Ba [Cololabis saira]|uniref:interleukin 12Ba n=1 Tax=Cololabis saira TaxID=129043 RepID=UPI002AD38ACD|nr:interleukin 12Ba [Cololabis saira]